MKRNFVIQVLAIMVRVALIVPLSIPFVAQAEENLPSPISFVNRMELGDLSQAEAWLDAGLAPDFMGSRLGSGLMIGAWENNIELMRLFISRGADINRLNSNGESAIVLAAWRGHLNAVKWLVDRGAHINAPQRHWSALHYAVFAGHAEVADYLIAQGADINARSSNGSTVLMMAIYEGREGLARQLIDRGADQKPKNDWGDGALEWSMRFNHLNIARLLTKPEEFNAVVSQPKEKWGEPQRSFRTSKDLESLLRMREILVERGASTELLDRRISVERVRIVRGELDRQAPPVRAATLEITASRQNPKVQSTQLVYDKNGQAGGFKVPPATYSGKPKMPPKRPVKNY
jgi:uncharacterized protein